MGIRIKASDLYYRYPKDTGRRHERKFGGKPDPTPFSRDDLYEVLPMLECVMDALATDDGRLLHEIEEIMVRRMPSFIVTREEVFDFLVGSMGDMLGQGN